ncbi:hypothetical protein [Leptospira sp. GIMC2001]|uniref:hypothetical protein n=1 Tax=Leptospira sp. GIMC2001 TaxID=1513297 RepID=UPI00234BD4D4|nr:hypothetical protein [Leptospira sp. GIMC2001]WCL48237.1 hypothetical protein O4O04_13080 [Leptospira sp. GIMC2001]
MSRKPSFFSILFFYFLIFISSAVFSQDKKISFLYIDANSGQSSGGHTALKIGDYVYHFQYYPDKIFHIVRESWFDFRFSYNIQENRTIIVSDLKLKKSDMNKIETGFDRLFLIQEKHFENLKYLQANKDIFAKYLSGKINTYPIEGIGYFSQNSKPSKNHLINIIRSKINNFDPEREKSKIVEQIQNLKYKSNIHKDQSINSSTYTTFQDFYSETYTDLVQKYVFYDAIENNHKLKPLESFSLHSEFINPISDQERIKLQNLSKNLELKLIEQISDNEESNHWGLLGCQILVFYLSLEASLESGYFHFPDSFPHQSEKIIWNRARNIDKLKDETLLLFNRYRNKYLESENPLTIEQFIDLTDAANRYNEIQNAVQFDRPIRNFPIKTMPNKRGIAANLPNFYIPQPELAESNKQATIEYDHYLIQLQKIYPYHLIFQNCTSEIFRSIDEFYNQESIKITQALGKQINPNASLSFVPFYANYDVQNNYFIESQKIILSYRRQLIRDMRKSQNSGLVFLRENFTPTSTIYNFNEEDDWFLLFTDENVFFRPIFGATNLITGLSQLLIGVPMAIDDSGDTFKKGWNGIFFSMPEMFFFNIRKGSFYNITTMDLDPEFPNETYKDSN